jgi:4-diphosphocytidyl-2-C-methyl-D-erythritol kinase
MLIHRRGAAVLVRAPAKINLHLEVLRRRPDGYHDLETLMVAVGLYDSLAFEEDPSGALRLECDLPSLSTGPDNLICRAAALLRERTGCTKGAAIRLWKRIPMAAGLAGGSSDAAAALLGLSRLWRLDLRREELARLGAELGSDVAFFFHLPAAWCTGRGEVIEPVRLGRPLHLVLAWPGLGLATADVFRNLTVPESPSSGGALREAVAAGDPEGIAARLHNRLQPTAERLQPAVARLREHLEALPGVRLAGSGVLMSGSGTAVFALCHGAADALHLLRSLRSTREEWPGLRVGIVRSCD